MVSATERNAGVRAGADACAAGWAGELVALRAGVDAWGTWAALAGLDAGVEDGPAIGEEAVDACTCDSFAGTLSTSDVFGRGGDAAAVEVDAC